MNFRRAVAVGAATALVSGGLALGLTMTSAGAAVTSLRLTDLNDGSGPFDTATTNNVTETHDAVVYQVAYNSNTHGGTEAFVFSLPAGTPAGVQIDPSDLSLCVGGSISPDGHTLTCPVDVPANTTGNVNVRVTVDGTVPNGSVINPVVSDDHVRAALTTPTSVVAHPQVTIRKNTYSTAVPSNGYSYITYYLTLANPADQRGAALINQPLTFTDSLVGLPADATVVGCGVSSGAPGIPFGRVGSPKTGTAANSTTNSGAITCVQTGNQVAVSIKGADLSGNTIPTEDATGLPFQKNGPSYLAAYQLQVRVPASEIPVGGLKTVNQITGFDPSATNADSSTTSQSDLPGGGVDPGANNGPACAYDATNPVTWCESAILPKPPTGVGIYTDKLLASAPGKWSGTEIGGGAKGTGTVTAGENYWAVLRSQNLGSTDASAPTVMCDRWNPSLQRLAPQGGAANVVTYKDGAATAAYTVKYGVFAASANNINGTTCDPSTITWYPSIAAVPGGLDAVDALLVTPSWNLRAGGLDTVNIQFQALANPSGTVIPDYMGYTTDGGASPADWVVGRSSQRDQVTLMAEKLRVAKSARAARGVMIQSSTQASVVAGTTVTYTLRPTVVSGISGRATSVVVTDHLPSCLTYVPGSVKGIAPAQVAFLPGNDGADGVPCTGDAGETGGTLTFQLGDIDYNGAIPEITYDATAVTTAADSTLALNTASITDPSADATLAANPTNQGLLADQSQRSVTYNTLIRSSGSFSISKTTSDPLVQLGDGFADTIAWVNRTGSTSTARMIDVLPYPGDTRATSTVGGSAFKGALAYVGSAVKAGAGQTVTVECTTDARASINTDPDVNTSTWSSTCPADTTALRITAANVPDAGAGSLKVSFADGGSLGADQFVNTVGGARVTGQPLEITESAPAVTDVIAGQISGVVWKDSNANGLLDPTENGRVAGVKVVLTGSDDKGRPVTAATKTAADGSYAFDELYSGTYSLRFTTPSGATWTIEHAGTSTNDSSVDASGTTDPIRLPAGGHEIANAGIVLAPRAPGGPNGGPTGGPTGGPVLPTPRIVTRVNRQHVLAGSGLFDSIAVSGLQAGDKISVTWRLLGPLAPTGTGCAQVDWGKAKVVASGTLPVDGNGTVRTPMAKVSSVGCYTYAESVEATKTTKAAATRPGVSTETALVTKAAVPIVPAIPTGGVGGPKTYAASDETALLGSAVGLAGVLAFAGWLGRRRMARR